MNEINFCSLENVSEKILFECASNIFLDTKVNGEIDTEDYKKRLADGNYSKEFSWGAFDNEKLVSIVAVGINDYLGKKSAYNIMTGALVDYREKNIVSKLLGKAIDFLKKNKFETFYLEVMTNNSSAIRTYQKNNFETTRTLMSFACKDNGQRSKKVKCMPFGEFDFSTTEELKTFSPTFLNSYFSLKQRSQELKVYFLLKNKKVVAMIVFDEKNNVVRSYADDEKRTRIPEIIRHLIFEKKTVFFRDVDNQDKEIIKILNGIGFNNISNQYEMKIDLI